MSRKLFATVIPSLLAGGLIFGTAVGSADDGRTLVGFWPAVSDVGSTTVAKPPAPPAKPPRPPRPPRAGGGFSVSVHDGKVQIEGIDQMVDQQIDSVIESLSRDSNVPPAVRAKVTKRLEKVRANVKKRVANLDADDLDDLGEELGKMGEELGKEMEEFGKEMEKFGQDFEKQMGKDFAKQMSKQWGKFNVHLDHDDDDDDDDDDRDLPGMPGVDDDDDLDDAVRSLGNLNLKQPQRDQIKKLRLDSDAKVATAKAELARAEENLQRKLENAGASDADIASAIDRVTQQEAAIRKARILAWVNARRVLDDAQRKKVESAKGKTR